MPANHPWWRHAVVYQVYIRSFADGNGDGTGDIAGLRDRLGHLVDLGVDAIWVNPWYPSPLHDGGYDVADYRDIHPDFGTLAEAEAFIADAHRLGLRVIVDLVPNHTSHRHAWFQAALAAPPGSAERQRYVFRRGRGVDSAEPPTNWRSVFGGPAWTRLDDGDWYLHLFDVTQPDLDWDNPEVRDEFDAVLAFWLDRGADGFRVDVAHGLVKDPTFPDVHRSQRILGVAEGQGHPFWDRDGIHEIVRRWRTVLDAYDDRMMVAEAWVHADRLPLYLRPDEYHQAFDFDLLLADWDASQFGRVIETSTRGFAAVGAAATWVLSNHDRMRHATRYALPPGTDTVRFPLDGPHDAIDPERGARRARAAALILLSLPGSAYLYQGEELGLPEVWDLPVDVLDDPTWGRSRHTVKGRDGCRVPIPWEPDGPSLGFGSGPAWLPQPASFAPLAASVQRADRASMLHLYRAALGLRRALFTGDEAITLLDLGLGPGVLAYERGNGVRCIANMSEEPVPLPAGTVVLASGPVVDARLPPDVAVWLTP